MYGLCNNELLFIAVLSVNCRAVWDIIRLLISRGGGHSIFLCSARSQASGSNAVSMLATICGAGPTLTVH